jgi:hypothetical protein
MTSPPITVQSRTAALARPRPRHRAPGGGLAGRRRALQVALGLIWLLDAAGYGPEPSRDRVHKSVIS